MIRLRRASLLLLPLLVALACLVGPGRAQTPASSARFAFADTTLLRDTLSLHFDRLFPLADSLGVRPDSLRALSVRTRLALGELVHFADSLGVPVDSIAAVLLRERFNPLAASGRDVSTLHYTSTYNIAQTSNTWINTSDYNLVRGRLFVRNTTDINVDKLKNGGVTSSRRTRTSTTESGVRYSPNLSVGGRVYLERVDNFDPSSIFNQKKTQNELQVSMRSRQQPGRGLSSELNVFTGVLDLNDLQLRTEKRGLNGEINGRVRYARGTTVTNDLEGQLTGNVARSKVPNTAFQTNTHDFSKNLRGTLALLPNAPLGLNVNYNLRDVLTQTPLDSSRIQAFRTRSNGLEATGRLRRDSDRYVNLIGRLNSASQVSGGSAQGNANSKHEKSAAAEGRYLLSGWTVESHFTLTRDKSEFPHGGYGESLFVRSLDGTLSRRLGASLVGKATGSVSLSSYRYYRLNTGATQLLPVKRDEYRQNYRLECLYSRSEKFNTAVALEVTRSLLVNLPSASTSANNEDRQYRAEWRWSYRLLRGLTATQRDQLGAHYVIFASPTQVNTLSLDYTAVTTLNAVITPRLTVDLTHNSSLQPSGNYVPQLSGGNAFSKASESQNYTLAARIAYTPSPKLSLSLDPNYLANNRDGTLNGAVIPQRRSRSLNFSGGANLNLPIGRRGRLTGDIRRSYQATGATEYTSGVPKPSPRPRPIDYWNGSLQVTWEL